MSYLFRYAWLSLCFALVGVQPTFALPSLTSTATSIASNLVLDGRGSASTHIIKVADISLTTDNSTGLSLFVSAGNITKPGGSSIAYEVTTVADGLAPPVASDFSSGNYTVSTSTSGQVNKDLYIKYTPATLQDPGNYSGAISLLVTDN
ncbi:MAG: hypothetical protein WBB28_13135 [Crinalium sp.]